VLAAIEHYKRAGDGYKARCPAHEDRTPSLSINEAEDNTVLLKCHAGCSTEAVVKALGLTLRDLFPRVAETPRKPRKPGVSATANGKNTAKFSRFRTAAAAVADCEKRLGPRSAWWTYHDAGGEPVAVVVRWDKADGKEFRPFAKTGAEWRLGDPDGLWPLYQLPALLQSPGRVYVCEGEKAADAVRSLGLTATTSAHGANSAKRTDWTPVASRQVVILPDHDDAGGKYAEEVIALLDKVAPRPIIKVVHLPGLPTHGDAVEYIAARRAAGLDDSAIRAEIQKLADDAEAATIGQGGAQAPITPILISMADVQSRPIEWLWPGRIARGKVTLIAGDPGLGKSFLTLDLAARVSRGSPWPDVPDASAPLGGVVLLSAEDDAEDTIRPRLDAAGADVHCIKLLHAVRHNYRENQKEALFSLATDLPALEAAILAVPDCRLVVIDPITAYLGDTDSHKNAEIRGLIAPLAALAAKHGVAIVCVTHLNKSGSGPAIYRSIGSIAFVAAARAAWAVIKDSGN
ncbi:MAG TPA: AAA family ATPase, partial [Magnetospirillum sp.]|nr:AAA family ATPase [Magnetospirillum sp.]